MTIKTKFNPCDKISYLKGGSYPSSGEIRDIHISTINGTNINNFGIYYKIIGDRDIIPESDIFKTPQEMYATLEDRWSTNENGNS